MSTAFALPRPFTAALCLFMSASLVFASTPVSARDDNIDKVKSALAKIGTGEKARVTLKLKSGAVLKGHIGALDKDDFSIVSKTGTEKILYSDVAKVKKPGSVWIPAVIVVGMVIGLVLGLMYAACGSGGCH